MAEIDEMAPPDLEKTEEKRPKAVKKKKGRGIPVNLLIIVISQLMLALGGFYVVSNFIEPDPALQKMLIEERLLQEEQENEGDAASGTEVNEDHPKQISLLEDIIVNPAGTRGSRYLSVSIGVEMNAVSDDGDGGGHGESGSSGNSIFNSKKLQLRDALIKILSSKTIIQLTTTEEKELIRSEILEKFGEILAPEPVFQIYFVDFVLQ